jgi:AraC family transcriptional regulator
MPVNRTGPGSFGEWPGLQFAEQVAVPPQEAREPVLHDHLIVIHLTPQPVKVFERADGYRGEGVARPGDINVFSAGDMTTCRWESDLSFFRLDLSASMAKRVAEELELPGGGIVDFGRHIRLRDDRILQIARWLSEDLRAGAPGGSLYAESLIRMLTVHMLHRYGAASARPGSVPGSLARNRLDGALQYIHAYLDRELSLEAIAAAAHVSPSHLVRLFRQATGLAPHQYVIRERIRRARVLLYRGHAVGKWPPCSASATKVT